MFYFCRVLNLKCMTAHNFFRVLNTAAVETLQESVSRRLWLLWMGQSIVSNTVAAEAHIIAAGIFHRDGMHADCSLCVVWHGIYLPFWFNNVFPTGLALASGLAATVTITHLLKAGDGIVCMDDVYGGEIDLWNLDNYVGKHDSTLRLHTSYLQNGYGLKEEAHFEYFNFLACKAQTVTSNELLLKLVWTWLLLTVQNQRSWSLLLRPTLK